MEHLIYILELIGTCAFAVSGAMVSISKRLDIFGVVFCGIITALGGGVIRDVLLSNLPPVMFCNYIYAVIAAISAIGTFLFARSIKSAFEEKMPHIDRINNIFDAVGLGAFTIIGINTAVSMGFENNIFFVLFLGMTTGCGGGLLRDILVREIPFILTKKIYAIASLLGGITYYVMYVTLHWNGILSVICSVGLIVFLRIVSSAFHWDLPRAY